MRYRLERLDERGVERSETLEADSRAAALASLEPEQRAGLRRLAPDASDPAASPSERSSKNELAGVARHLAQLLAAGAPLSDALRRWAGAGGQGLARAAARAEEGASLADALAAEGAPFTAPEVQALLSAAEAGGRLSPALGALADVADALQSARDEVLRGLAYPATIALIATLLFTGSLSFVSAQIPPAAFASWAEHPTLISRALAISSATPAAPWIVAGVWLVGVAGFAHWLRTRSPLRSFGARRVFVFRLLSVFCSQGLSASASWSALSATLGRANPQDLSEGGSLGDALAQGGWVKSSGALGLRAAEAIGPESLASELRALADDALADGVVAAKRHAVFLEALLLAAIGAAFVGVVAATLPLGWL